MNRKQIYKACSNCAFADPVLGAREDLICQIDQAPVSSGYFCDLFVEEHEFDPNPEYSADRDMPEECWLEN